MNKTAIADFDYILPEHLIAHSPAENREESRLMRLTPPHETITHHHIQDLPKLFRKGDVLVLNNTQVINARLIAHRETGAKIEIFLLEEGLKNKWKVLLKNARRVKEGDTLRITDDFTASVIKKNPDGFHTVKLHSSSLSIHDAIETYGELPLPPYIDPKKAPDNAKERYQTVFAEKPGAVAAPTAGLHFSEALLDTLRNMGVIIAYVTLHVGYGTFKPVESVYIEDHDMHSECYSISSETASILNTHKKNGARIIAVGTTVVRTLESACNNKGEIVAGEKSTNIFIYPGYQFKFITGLLTNFHLPKSTLLCLVSALAGVDYIKDAYELAVKERYRFYSFGDAMLILP